MKIYVLIRRRGYAHFTAGAFSTPEAAMAAWSPERPEGLKGWISRDYKWHQVEKDWYFRGSDDDWADIETVDLDQLDFVS